MNLSKIKLKLLFFIFLSFIFKAKAITPQQKLVLAIKDCNISKVEKIIINNANIINNVIVQYGKTPLHYVCENPNLEILQLVLLNGANVYVQDLEHKLPICYLIDRFLEESTQNYEMDHLNLLINMIIELLINNSDIDNHSLQKISSNNVLSQIISYHISLDILDRRINFYFEQVQNIHQNPQLFEILRGLKFKSLWFILKEERNGNVIIEEEVVEFINELKRFKCILAKKILFNHEINFSDIYSIYNNAIAKLFLKKLQIIPDKSDEED